MSCLLRLFIWLVKEFLTLVIKFLLVERKMALESLPCSSCDNKSAAINSHLSSSSPTTKTSLGPAGISIATKLDTIFLASVTYLLPGPKILSTLGIDSVPYANEKIA